MNKKIIVLFVLLVIAFIVVFFLTIHRNKPEFSKYDIGYSSSELLSIPRGQRMMEYLHKNSSAVLDKLFIEDDGGIVIISELDQNDNKALLNLLEDDGFVIVSFMEPTPLTILPQLQKLKILRINNLSEHELDFSILQGNKAKILGIKNITSEEFYSIPENSDLNALVIEFKDNQKLEFSSLSSFPDLSELRLLNIYNFSFSNEFSSPRSNNLKSLSFSPDISTNVVDEIISYLYSDNGIAANSSYTKYDDILLISIKPQNESD